MLLAVEHVIVAIAHGAGGKRGGVRAGAGLGQAIACQQFHGAEFRQPCLALRVRAERVDHPGRHVVDRHVGRHGRAAGSQRLEDQRRVEPRQSGAAHLRRDIDAPHAEFGGLAHLGNREMLGLIPGDRVRRENLGGEGARHVAHGDLIVPKRELRRVAG